MYATLGTNQTIHQNQFLMSENASYYLRLQPDGNLVGYTSQDFVPKNAFWSSKTDGKGNAPFRLVMQLDNNLVIYDGSNKPTWASKTDGKGVKGASKVVMQNDRNIVIYDGTGKPIWASKTD